MTLSISILFQHNENNLQPEQAFSDKSPWKL